MAGLDETPEDMKKWLDGYAAKAVVASTTGGRGKPHRMLNVRTVLRTPPYVEFEVEVGDKLTTCFTLDEALKVYCDGL